MCAELKDPFVCHAEAHAPKHPFRPHRPRRFPDRPISKSGQQKRRPLGTPCGLLQDQFRGLGRRDARIWAGKFSRGFRIRKSGGRFAVVGCQLSIGEAGWEWEDGASTTPPKRSLDGAPSGVVMRLSEGDVFRVGHPPVWRCGCDLFTSSKLRNETPSWH